MRPPIPRRFRRPIPVLLSVAAGALLLGACRGADEAGEAPEEAAPDAAGQRVYVDTLPSWYRDVTGHFHVSPDGEEAVYHDLRERRGTRRVHLASGRVDPGSALGSFDRVHQAVWRPDGELALLATRDGERAWFLAGGGPGDAAGGAGEGAGEAGDGAAGRGADGAGAGLPVPTDALPRWSPDGERVAYLRPGEPELFVGAVENPTRLRFHGGVTAADWSPAGEAVYALVLQPEGVSSLVRVAPDGSRVDTVARDLDTPPTRNTLAVGPGGEEVFLALAGSSAPDPVERHHPGADRILDLYAVSTASGALRQLTDTPDDEIGPSVGGGHLYWTRNDFTTTVGVIPADGGSSRVVVDRGMIPMWNPAGDSIAFMRGASSASDGALRQDGMIVAVDDSIRPLSEPEPHIFGLHEDYSPSWSPDGRWLAYHSHRSPGPTPHYHDSTTTDDVYLLRSGAPLEEEIRLTDFGLELGWVDWAPDGRRIAFGSWKPGGEPGISWIWILTIDPETGRLVDRRRMEHPAGVASAEQPAWAPDGNRLALDVKLEGGGHAILVGPADGGAWRQVVEFESATFGGLDWTPDGAFIVYPALVDGRMQLFRVPADGSDAPEQLTDGPANHVHPQVSPDGRWILASRLIRAKEIRRRPLEGLP